MEILFTIISIIFEPLIGLFNFENITKLIDLNNNTFQNFSMFKTFGIFFSCFPQIVFVHICPKCKFQSILSTIYKFFSTHLILLFQGSKVYLFPTANQATCFPILVKCITNFKMQKFCWRKCECNKKL